MDNKTSTRQDTPMTDSDIRQQFVKEYPGWQGVFDDLCRDIELSFSGNRCGFEWLQLKEKMGAARLYWRMNGYGLGASHLTDRNNTSAANTVEKFVRAAEQKTETLCAKCGGIRGNRGRHWLGAMCDACGDG
jgi:hypothetical protein